MAANIPVLWYKHPEWIPSFLTWLSTFETMILASTHSLPIYWDILWADDADILLSRWYSLVHQLNASFVQHLTACSRYFVLPAIRSIGNEIYLLAQNPYQNQLWINAGIEKIVNEMWLSVIHASTCARMVLAETGFNVTVKTMGASIHANDCWLCKHTNTTTRKCWQIVSNGGKHLKLANAKQF